MLQQLETVGDADGDEATVQQAIQEVLAKVNLSRDSIHAPQEVTGPAEHQEPAGQSRAMFLTSILMSIRDVFAPRLHPDQLHSVMRLQSSLKMTADVGGPCQAPRLAQVQPGQCCPQGQSMLICHQLT